MSPSAGNVTVIWLSARFDSLRFGDDVANATMYSERAPDDGGVTRSPWAGGPDRPSGRYSRGGPRPYRCRRDRHALLAGGRDDDTVELDLALWPPGIVGRRRVRTWRPARTGCTTPRESGKRTRSYRTKTAELTTVDRSVGASKLIVILVRSPPTRGPRLTSRSDVSYTVRAPAAADGGVFTTETPGPDGRRPRDAGAPPAREAADRHATTKSEARRTHERWRSAPHRSCIDFQTVPSGRP